MRKSMRLMNDERCACEQSNVSRHLARLKEPVFVARRIDDPRRMYRIVDPRVREIITTLSPAECP